MANQISADLAAYGIPDNCGLAAVLAVNFAAQGWAEVIYTRGLQIHLRWSDVGPAKVLRRFEPTVKGVLLR